MIYHSLEHGVADFLHDNPFPFDKYKFKLFSFSQILEKGVLKSNKNKKKFVFPKKIHIIVSSSVDDVLLSFVKILSKRGEVRLGNENLLVSGIEVLFQPILNENHIIKTLSPITIHTTYYDEKKYTYFYSPEEKEFPQLLEENLIKKFVVMNKNNTLSDNSDNFFFSIIPIKTWSRGVYYKNFFVQGWEGTFLLKTNKAFMQVAYDLGLGARNSAGFGLFDIIE